VEILLPQQIALVKHSHNITIEEEYKGFSIFYENIIYPLKSEYDILVDCKYGENLGTHWYIENLPDENFTITLKVYNEEGILIAKKSSEILIFEKPTDCEPFNILCIGASNTRSCAYLEHINDNLSNIYFKGTRSFNQKMFHEGRGGWHAYNYLHTYRNFCGSSPFVFPKGVGAKEYYGDMEFIDIVNDKNHETYSYDGYNIPPIEEGQIYHREEKLYRYSKDGDVLVSSNPKWEYRFDKYVEKYDIGKIDAVSLLFGGNDLQVCPYEESKKYIDIFIDNLEIMINGIHEYNTDIAVIVCMPLIGAEQYAWGKSIGTKGSSKMYRFNVQRASKQILEKWENCENIFIAPTLLNMNPADDFSYQHYKTDVYSENTVRAHRNWVHPNRVGYRHIADAVAGVIERIRKTHE